MTNGPDYNICLTYYLIKVTFLKKDGYNFFKFVAGNSEQTGKTLMRFVILRHLG